MKKTKFSWENEYNLIKVFDEMYQTSTDTPLLYHTFFEQFNTKQTSLKQKSKDIRKFLFIENQEI